MKTFGFMLRWSTDDGVVQYPGVVRDLSLEAAVDRIVLEARRQGWHDQDDGVELAVDEVDDATTFYVLEGEFLYTYLNEYRHEED